MICCRDRTNIIDIGIDITDVLRINDKVKYVLFYFLLLLQISFCVIKYAPLKVFAKLITFDVVCIGEPFLIRIQCWHNFSIG